MIILKENNTNEFKGELKNELGKKGVATVQKDSFVVTIEDIKMEDPCFELRVFCQGSFFKYIDCIEGVDKVVDYLTSLSLSGEDYDKFVLINQIKGDITDGKHNIFSKRTEDENKRFIKIYKKENSSDDEYNFSNLTKSINADFTKEPFYIEDMDKCIVVSSSILDCSSLKELFPGEMSFIKDVVDRHICTYCGSIVINERFVEYLEFGGCVGRDFICPDCSSLYSSGYFRVTNIFREKKLSNLERIEAVDFVLKSINNK